MAFKIKNMRPTFLKIELASQVVTLNSLAEAGPFEDAEMSPGLKTAENHGDVICLVSGVFTDAPQKPAKPAKEVDKS